MADDDGYFDAAIAETYDRDHGATDAAVLSDTVNCLADLAADGPILEFAIGTGRVALPLVERGCSVSGIELSQSMIDIMRNKPAGATLEVVKGDMTSARVPGSFALVFLVYNTIDNLTTQAQQVACFENAARHLVPGGRFVIETQVPPIQHLAFGETGRVFDTSPAHLGLDDIDIATQTYTSHHVWLDGPEPRHLAIPFRYAWPAEFDLMARIAGMEPEHRWGGWDRSPFTRLSQSHVSVWRKPRG